MSRNPRLLLIISAALCLLFAASYVGQMWRMNQTQATLAQEQESEQLAQQQNARLQDELTYVQSEAYAVQTARDELGQSQPGDQILLVLPESTRAAETISETGKMEDAGSSALQEAVSAPDAQLDSFTPNWQQWLSLFVDGV